MSATDSGSLNELLWPLAEKMATVQRQGASGRLLVTGADGVRELIFVNGELRAARSSCADERLGAWLVAHGVISDDDVAVGLLAQVRDNASPLGHLLVRRGVVEEDELERQLESLTTTIVERCAADDPLDVEMVECDTDDQVDTLLGISTSRMILAAARVHRDEAGMFARLGSLERPARRAAPLESIMFDGGFTMAELAVLQRIESVPVVADLESMTGADPAALVPALYALSLAGYIVIGAAASPQPAADARRTFRQEASSPAAPHTRQIAVPSLADGLSPAVASIFEGCLELVSEGRVAEAHQRLERLCAAEPRPIHLVRLARFMRQHEIAPRRILGTLQRALEQDASLAEGWFELALFWRRNRSAERQRKALTRVLHLQPEHAEARRLLDGL